MLHMTDVCTRVGGGVKLVRSVRETLRQLTYFPLAELIYNLLNQRSSSALLLVHFRDFGMCVLLIVTAGYFKTNSNLMLYRMLKRAEQGPEQRRTHQKKAHSETADSCYK